MIMTYPAYALDVDYELNMLERYFNIYRPMPKEIQEYLKFIPTKRLPLIPEDKEYNAPNQYVRNIPYSPYLCLPCVENYVIVNVYINLPLYKLFLSNPCKKNSKNFLKNYYGVDGSGLESAIGDVNETIITSWLSTNMITTDHYKIIKSLLDVILKKVMVYTDLYPNHIWELDWATSHVILINRGDIKAYRFDELRGLV